MFHCGIKARKTKSKNRSSKWHRPRTCFHGNQSLNTSKDYIIAKSPNLDFVGPLPLKKSKVMLNTVYELTPETSGNEYEEISSTYFSTHERHHVIRQNQKSYSLTNSDDSANGSSVDSSTNLQGLGDSSRSDTTSQLSGDDSGNCDWVAQPIQRVLTKDVCRGQLNLSIRIEDECRLVIFIREIRNIRIQKGCSLYVQTMLIPDPQKATAKETMTTEGKAEILEEISYDLKSDEEPKRLAVSAWLKDADKSSSEMKGCMSFGIKNLLSKNKKKEIPVDGWYSFLPETTGNKGHLSLNDQSTICDPKENKVLNAHIQKKIQDHQKYTVSLPKNPSGYGFTIKGTQPVRVGRVKPEGTAEMHGVRAGDIILSINGRDTAIATLECVTKIVRNSVDQLQMLMARPPNKPSGCLPVFSNCGPSKSGEAYATERSILDQNKDRVETTICPMATDEMTSAERISNWGMNLSKSALADLSNRFAWQPELSVINEERSPDLQSSHRHPLHHRQPNYHGNQKIGKKFSPATTAEPIYEEIETPHVKKTSHHNQHYQHQPPKKTNSWNSLTPETASTCSEKHNEPYSGDEKHAAPPQTVHVAKVALNRNNQPMDMNRLQQMWTYYGNEPSVCTTVITQAEQSSWLPGMLADESRRYAPFTSEDESSVGPSVHYSCPPSTGKSLTCSDERQVAIHQLLTCEEDFARLMKRGIQRFSRPLRHHILSRAQHAMLFQNIEKLVALTEFHIRNMIEGSFSAEDSYTSGNNNVSIDHVGSIYKPKIRMVCDIYRSYCEGLGRSLELLESLRQMPDFYRFQQRAESLRGFELGLGEFLQHPMAHFQQLVGSLGRVLLTTPQEHRDYTSIKAVMEVIHLSVTTTASHHHQSYNQSSTQYSRNYSQASGQSMPIPQTPSLYCPDNSRCTSVNASNIFESTALPSPLKRSKEMTGSRSSLASIDAEILEMQQNLIFPKHVKPFQLATPQRHVIFSGELFVDSEGTKSTTLWGVLCSDLLLLTQKDSEGHLKVVEEPLMMHQILETEFCHENNCEFSLLTSLSHHGAPTNSTGVMEYRLRSSNVEQKYAWKTLIEQRIKTCKSQTDSAFSSTEEFM